MPRPTGEKPSTATEPSLSLIVKTFMLLPCGLPSASSGYAGNPSPREGPTTLTASMHDAEGTGNSVALMYYSGSTMFAVCEAHEA